MRKAYQHLRGSEVDTTFGSHIRTAPPAPTTTLRSRLFADEMAVESTSICVMDAVPSALGATIPMPLKVIVVGASVAGGVGIEVTETVEAVSALGIDSIAFAP